MRSPLHTAALEYGARGWHVLPLYPVYDRSCGCGEPECKSPGKHPLRDVVTHGLHGASAFAARIDPQWTRFPDANIGIRTGHASGLLVIDIDDKPHEGRDGSATWRRLLTVHADGDTPDTVEALTGGGGRHLYFQMPPGHIPSSKDAIGPGIDVRAENGYVVAPPSLHTSGRSYEWDAFSHIEDTSIAPAPDWLVSLLATRIPKEGATTGRVEATLDPFEVEEIRSALLALSADHRDAWVQTGLALHQTGDDDAAFALWDAWSQTSSKYDAKDAKRVWQSFKGRPDGLTTATIYHRAVLAGWQRPDLATLATAAGRPLPVLLLRPPAHLVRTPPPPRPPAVVLPDSDPLSSPLPGALETIAQWSLATAPHPVRGYAVAAALALGSVLSGRRYTTDANNYSALYFLVVGKSGTGKEHVRQTIHGVLDAVGAPHLIGPNKWTSDSAVFSGLLQSPQHVAILDEFGQFLAGASGNGDGASMKDGVLTQLMELYGRLHGRAQSPQYATLTMSAAQKDAAKRQVIDRPSLTVVGLTTPAMFYAALKSSRVASGFLNRFCVIETSVPRQDVALPSFDPVPDSVVSWGRQLIAPTGDLDLLSRPTGIADPRRLSFTPDAHAAFIAWRRDCNKQADALEVENLGELPMRAAEQAMRLALIAALADDPTAHAIDSRHATWGVDVSRSLLNALVPAVRARMADSPLALLRKSFVAAVAGAGERGLTQYEINRSPLFHGTPRREREDVVAWALETQAVAWSMVASGGRSRRVLTLSQHFTTPEAA